MLPCTYRINSENVSSCEASLIIRPQIIKMKGRLWFAYLALCKGGSQLIRLKIRLRTSLHGLFCNFLLQHCFLMINSLFAPYFLLLESNTLPTIMQSWVFFIWCRAQYSSVVSEPSSTCKSTSGLIAGRYFWISPIQTQKKNHYDSFLRLLICISLSKLASSTCINYELLRIY